MNGISSYASNLRNQLYSSAANFAQSVANKASAIEHSVYGGVFNGIENTIENIEDWKFNLNSSQAGPGTPSVEVHNRTSTTKPTIPQESNSSRGLLSMLENFGKRLITGLKSTAASAAVGALRLAKPIAALPLFMASCIIRGLGMSLAIVASTPFAKSLLPRGSVQLPPILEYMGRRDDLNHLQQR